ncbi:hypothetical protein Tco_1033832 [Tanacetum coccineum]
MGDEHLSILSTEEIVLISRESEETSRSKNDLPSCDDFSSINVPRDDSMTFSNPLFEFDVNFHNPLFDEELEDIECKDSYDSNLDESTFLVTPLSNSNKDECLTPENDIAILLHHGPSTPLKSVASILEGFIEDPPFKENEFDLECKTNDEAECFNPGEIDDFLAIEVPTYNEGYYDSEGDELVESRIYIKFECRCYSKFIFPVAEKFSYNYRVSSLSINLIEDSDSNREEIDIFSGPDDSIPLGIESDFDSKEDIIDNLLNDDPIPEYEHLTFDMEPDVPVINNVNEDECFDPRGGEINVEVNDSFTFVTRTFFCISLTLRFFPYFPLPRMRTPFLTSASPLRAGGISSGWNFHVRILQITQENGQNWTSKDTRTEKSAQEPEI